MHCITSLLLSLLLLCISQATVYQVAIESANPTYIQLCIRDTADANAILNNLELFTYDWDTNIEQPQRNWYALTRTSYDDHCWYYATPTSIALLFIPVSLRLTTSSNQKAEFTNLITSLSVQTITANTSNYTIPVDKELTVPITSSGNVSAYNTAATYFDPNTGACMLEPLPSAYADMYAAIRVQIGPIPEYVDSV
jgi:hypothetical protein